MATLVVVLLLFLIVSMVAAYTNRNLIFEQRTATNQYRSTQAHEAAEAGLQWALAMLNHARIGPGMANASSSPSCLTSTNATDSSFRQRYLNQNLTTGYYSAKTYPVGSSGLVFAKLLPTCVASGDGWICDCPSAGVPQLTAPSGDAVRPAFRVRFTTVAAPAPPGLVRIEAVGCTRLDSACLDFTALGAPNEGRAIATQLVALTGTAVSPPSAALTTLGNINFASAAQLINGDTASGGWTMHTRGSISGNAVTTTIAGSPSSASQVAGDTTLPSTADRFFSGVFNMFPGNLRLAPGTVRLGSTSTGCSSSGCSGAAVAAALSMNPGRVVWVDGDLNLESNVGSTAEPALLIVNGNLNFSANVTLTGLVYVRNPIWAPSYAGGQIVGAVIVEGEVANGSGAGASGTPTITYNADALRYARLSRGSFVAVPGGWKDFCSTQTGAVADPDKC
jgi:hypothetical protein